MTDGTLKSKHAKLDLDPFWILIDKEYPSIAQKDVYSNAVLDYSYLCEFGFSAMTTIKTKSESDCCLLRTS